MTSTVELPIFRAGRYPQAASIVPNGHVTDGHIAEIAANTQRILRETTFRPAIKLGHVRDGDAAGWIVGVRADGPLLFAHLEFNDLGAGTVKRRTRRFVSAEIAKQFSLTGSDEGVHVGLNLKGLALLGAEAPQIKNLCDLADIKFSEAGSLRISILRDSMESRGNAVVYFAEITPRNAMGITAEDFRLAVSDLSISRKVSEAYHAEMLIDPTITFDEFMRMAAE
jgi:hypothetical protein